LAKKTRYLSVALEATEDVVTREYQTQIEANGSREPNRTQACSARRARDVFVFQVPQLIQQKPKTKAASGGLTMTGPRPSAPRWTEREEKSSLRCWTRERPPWKSRASSSEHLELSIRVCSACTRGNGLSRTAAPSSGWQTPGRRGNLFEKDNAEGVAFEHTILDNC
jgi:hypothetical protein